MRKFLLFIFVLCISQSIFAQRHEIGIFAGGANVIGDVGKGNYINPFPTKLSSSGSYYLPISIGGLYRFNFNPHMGFRLNLTYSRVGASDHLSGEQYKIDRNKNFSNNIVEGAVLFEYNFTDINDAQEFAHSPYIFFGAGVFGAKNVSYDINEESGNLVRITKNKTNFTTPIGVGYKIRINYNWLVSFETGFRYTNQDYLDYNNPEFSDELKYAAYSDPLIAEKVSNKKFGNVSNKDWYVQTGFTLTYSFGRPACYCN